MKKIMMIGLILILFVSVIACESETKSDVDIETFILNESVALTLEMHEFAADEAYVSYMMQSFEIKEIIKNIASTDYSLPEKAYVYEFPEEQLVKGLMDELGDESISDALMEKITQKFNGTMFASMINGQYGSETLAATSITGWGKSYIKPAGFEEDLLIVLVYPDDFSSMISFSTTGEGVIGGVSSFIANGNVDLESLLSEMAPLENLEAEIYTKEQLKKVLENE